MNAYEQLIKDKNEISIINILGYAYRKSGKYKEAIESFRQTIRIDPDYAAAHYNLGNAYLGSNDRGSALEQYKILKSLDAVRANKLFNL